MKQKFFIALLFLLVAEGILLTLNQKSVELLFFARGTLLESLFAYSRVMAIMVFAFIAFRLSRQKLFQLFSGRWGAPLFNVLFFAVLFTALECYFKIEGQQVGVRISAPDNFKTGFSQANYELQAVVCDSFGINYYNAKAGAAREINAQGFLSPYNYSADSILAMKKRGKKIVMVVGDSFVEGCCVENHDSSFAEILRRALTDSVVILNFGVASTDPLQYELVVQHYAPLLQPDEVAIVFYTGNDFMEYERKPTPYIPIYYFLGDGYPSQIPNRPIGECFKSAAECWNYFARFYRVDAHRGPIAGIAKHSRLLSNAYLDIYEWRHKQTFNYPVGSDTMISYRHIKNIVAFCDSLKVPIKTFVIPAEDELAKDYISSTQSRLPGIALIFPPAGYLTPEDHTARKGNNHFNGAGHYKYAAFMKPFITNLADSK